MTLGKLSMFSALVSTNPSFRVKALIYSPTVLDFFQIILSSEHFRNHRHEEWTASSASPLSLE
jgi:hypothetical protein